MPTVLLTGTPGTGKTTVAQLFSKKSGFKIIGINEVVGQDYLYIDGDSKVVDLNGLSEKISELLGGSCIVEGHLAHLLEIDGTVIVLRTNPAELEKRLQKRGYLDKKLEENLEAEALDICLMESLERYKDVSEIDTTTATQEEVAESISLIIEGSAEKFKHGKIDWLEDYVYEKGEK